MRFLPALSKLLIFGLILWAVYVSVSAFFGIQIYFPLRLAEANDIPYHRWQSVRIAAFLTMSYFMVLHLLDSGRQLYPLKCLEIFLTIYTPVLVFFTYRAAAPAHEYLIAGFFGVVVIILHISSKDRVKKYFQKKP